MIIINFSIFFNNENISSSYYFYYNNMTVITIFNINMMANLMLGFHLFHVIINAKLFFSFFFLISFNVAKNNKK